MRIDNILSCLLRDSLSALEPIAGFETVGAWSAGLHFGD